MLDRSTTYVAAAYCYWPSSVVCRSVCHSSESSKTAEPIELPFGLWTRVGQRKYALVAVHTGTTWRTSLNRRCAATMRPFCHITLTTCYELT